MLVAAYQVQIDRVFDWEKAEEALGVLESNENLGKVILKVH